MLSFFPPINFVNKSFLKIFLCLYLLLSGHPTYVMFLTNQHITQQSSGAPSSLILQIKYLLLDNRQLIIIWGVVCNSVEQTFIAQGSFENL